MTERFLELLKALIAIPAPPGQEEELTAYLKGLLTDTPHVVDPRGNLLVGDWERPKFVVTAHMDEIALMVSDVSEDFWVRLAPMGGLMPWKWGEQPIEILTSKGAVPAWISFGSIHTTDPSSPVQQARTGPLTWALGRAFTGLSAQEMSRQGVRTGSRAVLARTRREASEIGPYIGSYFIDDRALVALLLFAIERFDPLPPGVCFAATTAEEGGAEGAAYLMNKLLPDRCIALEISPSTPETTFVPDPVPTIWAKDGHSAPPARDMFWIEKAAERAGCHLRWQFLSRAGSDASIAQELGSTASGVTIGIPVESSHGFEFMHKDAPEELLKLLVAMIETLPAD